MRHGFGTMFYTDKMTIACNWKNDLPDDKGHV